MIDPDLRQRARELFEKLLSVDRNHHLVTDGMSSMYDDAESVIEAALRSVQEETREADAEIVFAVARDIGTVSSVIQRKWELSDEEKKQVRKLDDWRSRLLAMRGPQ